MREGVTGVNVGGRERLRYNGIRVSLLLQACGGVTVSNVGGRERLRNNGIRVSLLLQA